MQINRNNCIKFFTGKSRKYQECKLELDMFYFV